MPVKRKLAKENNKPGRNNLKAQKVLPNPISPEIQTTLSSAVNEMASALGQSAAGVDTVTTTMDEIKKAADLSEARLKDNASAVNTLRDMAQSANDRSSDFLKKLETLTTLVVDTSSDINGLIEGLSVAAEVNSIASKNVLSLKDTSMGIGEMAKQISEVADQVNLLALNAAIEASKAGEHGRGFAVVAEEIRKLAGKTETNAGKINDIITSISESVENVVEDAGKTAKSLADDVDRGKEVTAGLLTVDRDLQEVNTDTNEILNLSANQLNVVKELQKGIDMGYEGSQELAASLKEIVSACQEQTATILSMKRTTEELNQIRITDDDDNILEYTSAAQELSSTVQEATATGQQISHSVDRISEIANTQAKTTQDGANKIQEGAKEVEIFEDKTSRGLTKTADLQKLVREKSNDVNMMIERIRISIEANSHTSTLINNLNNEVRKIDKIVGFIDNVTVQTNLLAVNGGIEAARAGDYGDGFVVVSEDCLVLAEEVQGITDRIRDQLVEVQDALRSVVTDVTKAGTVAQGEVERARKTTKSLKTIENDIDFLRKSLSDISNSANAFGNASIDARKAIDDINNAAIEVGSATIEARTAALQQASAMQQINLGVKSIIDHAKTA